MIEKLGENRCEVIYLPPYTPEFMPIELVLSYVKRFVASKFVVHQSVETLRQNVILRFYGDGAEHQGVNSAFCENIISHCKFYMNKFIKEDGELTGNIDHLQYKKDLKQTSNLEAQQYTFIESHDSQHDNIDDFVASFLVDY
mgnify:CR=1 FL=1